MKTNLQQPMIHVEMEGIKHSVMHYFADHSDEMNAMVQETLAATLTEEWVKTQIQQAVNKTITNAINNLGDNYVLRTAVDAALGKALAEMIDPTTKVTDNESA